jgi:hypothetical protein
MPQLSLALASPRCLLAKRCFSAVIFPARVSNDSLSERSKALAQSGSPQGLGLEPRSCHSLRFLFAFGARCVRSEVDVELAIPGSVGRCLSGRRFAEQQPAETLHHPCRDSSTSPASRSTEGRQQRRSQGAERLEAPDSRCRVEGDVRCWLRSPPSGRKRQWAALLEGRARRRPLSSVALAPNSSP